MVLGWQQKLNIHHVSGVAEMVDLGRKGLILSFIARWHRPFIYIYIFKFVYIYIYLIYRSLPLSTKSDARKTFLDEKTFDEVHDSFYRIVPGGSLVFHWMVTFPKTNSKTNPEK